MNLLCSPPFNRSAFKPLDPFLNALASNLCSELYISMRQASVPETDQEPVEPSSKQTTLCVPCLL